MAMVAAAVANHGTLMTPHFIDKVVDQDGRTVKTIDPTVYHAGDETFHGAGAVADDASCGRRGNRYSRPSSAASRSPARPAPRRSARTGSGLTQPWFIGFAPAEDPKVAVAVTIAQTQGGFGGTVAAPIAKAVIQTLLAEGK